MAKNFIVNPNPCRIINILFWIMVTSNNTFWFNSSRETEITYNCSETFARLVEWGQHYRFSKFNSITFPKKLALQINMLCKLFQVLHSCNWLAGWSTFRCSRCITGSFSLGWVHHRVALGWVYFILINWTKYITLLCTKCTGSLALLDAPSHLRGTHALGAPHTLFWPPECEGNALDLKKCTLCIFAKLQIYKTEPDKDTGKACFL